MNGPASTRISEIYDWLFEQIQLALPTHRELSDPDDLFESLDSDLAQGFGVTIGEGENTQLCIDARSYYYKRDFTVILTREVLTQNADAKSRRDKWKQALEDLHQVLARLTPNVSIVDQTVSPARVNSFKFLAVNDGGPRSTTIRDINYVFIELTVSAEYREPIPGGS